MTDQHPPGSDDPWRPEGAADHLPASGPDPLGGSSPLGQGPGSSATPPGPPTPPIGGPSELTLSSEATVTSGGAGSGVTKVAAIVAGVGLVGGGLVFAATQLTGDAGEPEDALADLLTAVEEEDVLGMLATLDPGERDVLLDPIRSMGESLERTEILSEDVVANGLSGVEISFDDVVIESVMVRDDLARLYVTGGTTTGSYDSDELPVGDFLLDTFERFDYDHTGQTDTGTEELVPDFDGVIDDEGFVVARKVGGSWKLSLGYTAAEAARHEQGGPVPAPGGGLAAVGADAPQSAVEGMIRDLLAADFETAIARLSPNEFRALHEYWYSLDFDDAMPDEGIPDGVVLDLERLDLSADVDGDRALVTIDGFRFTIEIDESGQPMDFTIDQSGSCVTLSGSLFEEVLASGEIPPLDVDLTEPICVDDLERIVTDLYNQMGLPQDLVEFSTGSFATPANVTVGITTHRVDGEWYVAPISTGMDSMAAGFAALTREDLDAWADAVAGVVDTFGQLFLGTTINGSVGGGFSPGFEDDFGVEEQFDSVGDVIGGGGIEYDDGNGGFEVDDGFDEPIDPQFIDSESEAILREALRTQVGLDEFEAECVYDLFVSRATFDQFYDITYAFEYGYEPEPDSVAAFEEAYALCV